MVGFIVLLFGLVLAGSGASMLDKDRWDRLPVVAFVALVGLAFCYVGLTGIFDALVDWAAARLSG